MTVSIVCTQSDLPVAESLKRFLEAQVFSVRLESGPQAGPAETPTEALVLLWSKESPFAPDRLAFEKRALDAWADGNLVFVKLDAHFAPIGLRDLPSIDATFETQRELVAWRQIAKRLREMQQPSRQSSPRPIPGSVAPQSPVPGQTAQVPAKSNNSGCAAVLLLAIGTLLLWAGFVEIPARSGGNNEEGPARALTICSLAAGALLVLLAITGTFRRSAKRSHSPSHPGNSSRSIFVSYARADASVVDPICQHLVNQGHSLWIDRNEIDAGENWAGEIVRAIKTVRGVAVMCSKSAFESDHVKREVYLADRYKRKIVPVFIEDASVPEDFEYFFAGVQWLKLKDTPQAERGKLVAKAFAGV